jgi:hypothetical protein
MDPLQDGNAILRKLAYDFGDSEIIEANDIDVFFSRLLKDTKGLVILDFLDTANWDRIESYQFEESRRHLTLTWHNYTNAQEGQYEKSVRRIIFPADIYRAFLHIQSVVPVPMKESAIFLINGFTLSKKRIKAIFQPESSEFDFRDTSFFEKRVIRRHADFWEIIDCHCTPLYTMAILPKNSGLSSFDSKKILYHHNLNRCRFRLNIIVEELKKVQEGNIDIICEKANTVRRILENILKLECCYREIEASKNYSEMLLGDLIRSIKSYKSDTEKQLLNKLVVWLNELSHDAGRPVVLAKAHLSALLLIIYLEAFRYEVNSEL